MTSDPVPAVRSALAPLLVRPAATAVVTDFDGTVSPIVENPSEARPLDGVAETLASLARRFAVVAVVSGRSVSFLEQRLVVTDPEAVGDPASTGPAHRVQLVGLHGLERLGADGRITVEPEAERWHHVVIDTAERLRHGAPAGVLVEPKGLAVTVHWRHAPDAVDWVESTVAREVERTGLGAHGGRFSVELRPPVDVDKGSVIRGLTGSCEAACYFGDDLGDMPAFEALAALSTEVGMRTVSVAVVDDESNPLVAESADVTVAGPTEALAALAWLAAAPTGGAGS
ncbi:MAG: trehalose-phosphatase [Acidimicrobiales bacterium]